MENKVLFGREKWPGYVVMQETGVRIHDTSTRFEYKEDNCDFLESRHVCV
jgi:hypothetical protein